MNDVDSRLSRVDDLAIALSDLSDDAVATLTAAAAPNGSWGGHAMAELNDVRFFAKRIPVTDREFAERPSTANHYDLAPYLNYPYGSPGLNVFRELEVAKRTRGLVASGQCEHVTVLVHHRLLSVNSADPAPSAGSSWATHPAFDHYLRDRLQARHQLLLCYEAFEGNAVDHCLVRPEDSAFIVEQIGAAIDALGALGIAHLDVDFFNVVTGNNNAYLTDYGLALADSFDLNDDERLFLEGHGNFDRAGLLLSLGHQLGWLFLRSDPDRKQTMAEAMNLAVDAPFENVVDAILANLDRYEQLWRGHQVSAGLSTLVDLVRQDLPTILYMHGFYTEKRRHWTGDSPFDNTVIGGLFKDVRPSTDRPDRWPG